MKWKESFTALLILVLFSVSAASCHSSQSFNFGPYSEAEHLYKKGKYKKAIDKYQEYLRDNPDGNMAVISYYYLAKSYEGLDQTEKAKELYEKIVKEHPGLVWADFSKTRLEELSKSSASKQ